MVPKGLKKKLGKVKKTPYKAKKPALHRLGKIVRPSSSVGSEVKVLPQDLRWQPVEIPDTLGDYEGFYGLEEIEGVDVKYVDGKPQLVIKDEMKDLLVINEEEKLEMEKNEKAAPAGKFELDKEDIEKLKVQIEAEAEAANENSNEQAAEEPKATEIKSANENEKPAKAKKQKPEVTKLIASRDEDGEKQVPVIPGQKDQKLNDKKTKKEKKQKQDLDKELEPLTFKNINEESISNESVSLPAWSELNPDMSMYTMNSLAKQGFKTPTEIQKSTIPLISQGKDIIGRAVTGSGKTLAYGIPIVEEALIMGCEKVDLPEDPEARVAAMKGPSGIIFTPTRELATQVREHLKSLIANSPIPEQTIMSLTGGLSIQKQERLLSYDPRIIIATPGRFLEILEKSTLAAKQLAKTKIMVLDEADRLLLDGQFEDLEKTMSVLSAYKPVINGKRQNWQTLVFSATFSKSLFTKLDSKKKAPRVVTGELDSQELIETLTKKLHFRSKPTVIDSDPSSVLSKQITEAMIPCTPMDRDLMLYYFLTIYPGSTLIFCNSIDSVKRLAPTLNLLGIPSISLHSNMIQKQRLRCLEKFQQNCKEGEKNGKASVMIASDVAARGLDVKGVKHVVHYHLPRTADAYVHRSGRTARAGEEGVSVVLCDAKEASGPLKTLRKIVANSAKDATLDGKPTTTKLGSKDLKMLDVEPEILDDLRQRMRLAGKIAKAEIFAQMVKKDKSWMDQAAEDLGVDELSDFEDDFLKKERERRKSKVLDKGKLKYLKGKLNAMLSEPIRGRTRRSYITGGLDNLAEKLLKEENQKKESVVGWLKRDALDDLKSGSKKRKI